MRFDQFSRPLRLAALLLVLTTSPALPHGDGDMGKPQHGGLFVLDEWHRGAELVVNGNTMVFHMTEHLEPADQTGASYAAIIEQPGGKTKLPLTIDGSMVTGKLTAPLAGRATVILEGLDSSGTAFTARFETR